MFTDVDAQMLVLQLISSVLSVSETTFWQQLTDHFRWAALAPGLREHYSNYNHDSNSLRFSQLLLVPMFHSGRIHRHVVKKGKVLYSTVSNPQDCSKRFTLYFPDRSAHSDTISASLGSIQPYVTINARRLLVNTSTTVYSHVFMYTAE